MRRAIDGDNGDDRERALQYQQAHFTLRPRSKRNNPNLTKPRLNAYLS
jgi:hypothetical protein